MWSGCCWSSWCLSARWPPARWLALTDAQRSQEECPHRPAHRHHSSLRSRPAPADRVTGRRAASTAFTAEITRYDEVYDVAVAVFDRWGVGGRLPAAVNACPSSPGSPPTGCGGARGAPVGPTAADAVDEQPIAIAEPVLVDGEVVGAVMMVSPTDTCAPRSCGPGSVIAGAAPLALAGTLVALPLTVWIPARSAGSRRWQRVGTAVVAGSPRSSPIRRERPPELRPSRVGSFDRFDRDGARGARRAAGLCRDASHQLRNPLCTALRLRLSNLDGHVERGRRRGARRGDGGGRAAVPGAGRPALRYPRGEGSGVVGWGRGRLGRRRRRPVENWRPLAEHTGVELRRSGPRGLRPGSPRPGWRPCSTRCSTTR
ncbi:hypothetical protein HBB16_03315 [Pseudonocardia sp. MCCB 268]|nr:hypothetical protein [Pseudonocardia cytotoxica]